jgi:glycosyltransferase involved in cell wall biosynthesis
VKIAIIGTVATSILGFRREFIECLLARGHEVYAFAADYTAEQMEEVNGMGAVAVPYDLNRVGMNPFSDAWNTVRLARQLRAIKPDLVFSYFTKPVVFGTLAACLAGVKRRAAMLEGLGFVFTDYPEGPSAKTKLLRLVQTLLYRLSLPRLQTLVFLNPDDPKDLLERCRIKVAGFEVLGGIGVSLAQYPYSVPGVPPSSPVSFLFIGRLLREKGIGEFLAAAKLVKRKYPNASFKVIGERDRGSDGGSVASLLDELIEAGVVEYAGQVKDVAKHIAHSSVFVLPSYREGVPRSTQEALAIGRPVITTDVPGCRETVVDGGNGFLVPPWNAQVIADKMCYFIEHPEQIEPMGLASYRLAQERFDAHKVAQKLVGILGL